MKEKNVTGGRQVIEALEKSYVRSLKGKANVIVAGLQSMPPREYVRETR